MKRKPTPDFSPSMLPQTRKDQFFFLLKNQHWTLLKIGFLALLFALPYLFLSLAKDILNYEFLNLLNQGSIEEGEYHTYFLLNTMGANLIGYLLLPLLGLGLAGINRIMRAMVEGDSVLFKDDFRLGVKYNYGKTSLGLLLFSFLFLLHQFAITYFQSPVILVPCFLLLILLLAPICFIYLVYSSFYEDGFFAGIANAVRLYPSSWWRFLLLGAFGVASFYGLDSIPNYYIKGIVIALFVVLLFPCFALLFFEVAIHSFDNAINSAQFKDRCGLGLYQGKKEEK